MIVRRVSVVLTGSDREGMARRLEAFLRTPPQGVFTIPGSDLTVTAFPGFSVLSGPPASLAPVRDLRATVFVDSLRDGEGELVRLGWKKVGAIGGPGSLLARDPDGNLVEFVADPSQKSDLVTSGGATHQ